MNIVKSYLLSISILLLSFSANAIVYPLNSDGLMELEIAKYGPTRINIEGERINDIFIHPQEAAEMVVHDSGCLFILPQQGKSKIYVTLIGENGTVQDLVLRFTGKSPAPIKLIKFNLAREFAEAQAQSVDKAKDKIKENNNGCKQKSKKCRN